MLFFECALVYVSILLKNTKENSQVLLSISYLLLISISYKFIYQNKNSSEFFNPMIPQMGRDNGLNNVGQATKADYQKYGWLFGS